MLIWIDLANSPHVPFFRALAGEFGARGHEVCVTAREFAQTIELAEAAGMSPEVVGGHGGAGLRGKAGNLVGRAWALARWAKGRGVGLAVGHNSYSQVLAARALGLRAVTLMDYEHQPANHLAFRLASRVVVPEPFPAEALRKFGAASRKVRRYRGIKEDVYLADFEPDPEFAGLLMKRFGIDVNRDTLVVVRPPASEALYHRFENELFGGLLARLLSSSNVKVVVLARTAAQREELVARHEASGNLFAPREALDGANLVAAADLVVSAGGTMNREAAALGVPAATVYAGRWAAVDEYLVREGRLKRISTREDVDALRVEKKGATDARRRTGVRAEVAGLILE